ncbi:glycosyltransferase family 1 protein [Proteiniphilum sp.]|uniref:glycosyltransferase family 1 protein n=1 Tax=Proteiniphilum sp. TaxID=1926877 RepID=UPI00332D5C3F
MSKDPIRVLHVVTIMNLGGIENLLMSIYRNIDRTKIQFDFLVHREEKGIFDDEIISMGGKIHKMTPIILSKWIDYYRKLKYFFNTHDYQIVHSHLNANSTIVLGIAKKANIKYRIAHSHIDKSLGSKAYLKSILRKGINKVSTKRFACSQQAGKWLYGQRSKFEILYNSIETNRFIFDSNKRLEIRKKLSINSNEILLGNIARFTPQKNHTFIIDVFNSYQKINPSSKLLLIGEGELSSLIKEKIYRLGLENKVFLPGALKNVNDYLNALDLFLFPSLFEGLGIVAIEAQANGLPILITDTLPKEIDVTNLVERMNLKENSMEWAKKINFLINKDVIRMDYNKLIKTSNYDIHKNANFLMEYYLSLK